MCSATFGDEMWSCRGVGLTRVLAAIKVRSGPVRLVFESPNKYQETKKMTAQQIRAKQEAAAAAQRKKDSLLQELEADEKVGRKRKSSSDTQGNYNNSISHDHFDCFTFTHTRSA